MTNDKRGHGSPSASPSAKPVLSDPSMSGEDPAGDTSEVPYDHKRKVAELLREEGEPQPFADPFMGF